MRCDRDMAKVNREETCDSDALLCNDCWLTRRLLPSHFMHSTHPDKLFLYMSRLRELYC